MNSARVKFQWSLILRLLIDFEPWRLLKKEKVEEFREIVMEKMSVAEMVRECEKRVLDQLRVR